jgi:hypothetical protein
MLQFFIFYFFKKSISKSHWNIKRMAADFELQINRVQWLCHDNSCLSEKESTNSSLLHFLSWEQIIFVSIRQLSYISKTDKATSKKLDEGNGYMCALNHCLYEIPVHLHRCRVSLNLLKKLHSMTTINNPNIRIKPRKHHFFNGFLFGCMRIHTSPVQ